jgi:RluA family pseudouridine synthase
MNVIFFDDSIIVVNKPPGIATIPGSWEIGSGSLAELLESDYGRIWFVHRLDKVTSGLVIFARTADVHRILNMLFERHQVQKVYHALIVGSPEWDEHTARHPLRINVGHSHRTVVDHGKGKPSETTFHILERFIGYTLLEAFPFTGRTHQVRVHAYALGFPLLGDTLYSAPQTDLILRPALHAQSITFPHPVTGEQMTFSVPYPEDFAMALEKIRAGQ